MNRPAQTTGSRKVEPSIRHDRLARFQKPLPGLSGHERLMLFLALPSKDQAELETDLKHSIADRRFAEDQVEFQARPKPRQRRKVSNTYRALSSEWRRGTEVLAGIPAEEYIPALTDSETLPGGRCHCPLPDHEDRNPSATYKDTVWFCHRCGEGGGIFQLASAITGKGERGDDFCELRKWLAERLLGVVA